MGKVVKRIGQELLEDIDWLNNISLEQKERLKTFLLNLDKSHRADLTSERSKKIIQGVNQIMNTICQNIAERKSCFSGKLLKMGSSHNDTKIGNLDEFDFVYEIDLTKLLLNGKDGFIVCRGLSKHKNQLVIELEETSEFCLPVNITAGNVHFNSLTPKNKLVNAQLISKTFGDILKDVLAELEIPLDWSHGGFNRPDFSGLRKTGPAFLLQFDYLKTNQEDHLSLSIDFVPMIRVDIKTDWFLSAILTDLTWPEYSWLSVNRYYPYLLYVGQAEEEWLAQYPPDSMSKTLIRICKALHCLAQLPSPGCLRPDDAEQILEYCIKQRTQGDSTKTADLPDINISHRKGRASFEYYGTDDYASYSDIGETIGNGCIIKSHSIKQTVMAMMAMDKSHGHDWTEDDLPDLVMSFYMIIRNVANQTMNRDIDLSDVVEKELSVSWENMFLVTDTERSTPPQTGKRSLKKMFQASDPKCPKPNLTGKPFTEETFKPTDPKCPKLQLTGKPFTDETFKPTDPQCPKPQLTGKKWTEEMSQASDIKCPTPPLTGKSPTEEMSQATDTKYRKTPLEGNPPVKHKLKAPALITAVAEVLGNSRYVIIFYIVNHVYLSGLAAIFRVFRCVCEGKKTANVVTLKFDKSCISPLGWLDSISPGRLYGMLRNRFREKLTLPKYEPLLAGRRHAKPWPILLSPQ